MKTINYIVYPIFKKKLNKVKAIKSNKDKALKQTVLVTNK